MEILEREEQVIETKQPPRHGGFGLLSLYTRQTLTFSATEFLEEVDGIWTVRDLQTGVFGTGADRQAALEDFDAALHEHLDVLERQPSLSEALQGQLHYLRGRLSQR